MASKGKTRTRKQEHYVNNKDFIQALVDYKRECKKADKEGEEIPPISSYIGECFLRIAEGLSHKPKFYSYTYREEMVMDAVENCVKAVRNYNVEAETRSGNPNAFGYFTQISWYAFLRRIAKEKKQQEIKEKYMQQASVENFIDDGGHGGLNYDTESFIGRVKNRYENYE